MVVGRHKRAATINEKNDVVIEKNFESKVQSNIIREVLSKPIQHQTTNSSVASATSCSEKSPVVNNLGAYMERIVETLVMNGGKVVQQNLTTHQQQNKVDGISANKEATLSYNQVVNFKLFCFNNQ